MLLSLFNKGGILDSQTTDTQFFGFSQSAAVANDGSPVRKKMFRPSVSPAKPQTPKFAMPSIGKPSIKRFSVKEDEAEQSPVKLREEPPRKSKDIEDSDGTITTKELGVFLEENDEEWVLRVSQSLEELESARLNVQLLESVVHKELRLAREKVEELELELKGLLTSRFARMKVRVYLKSVYWSHPILFQAISKSLRVASDVHASMPSDQRAQSWTPDDFEDEDPYHPSTESQMFRQLSEGYRAFYADSWSPTNI